MKNFIILGLLLFCFSNQFIGQQNLEEKLVSTGFENIRIHQDKNEYTISFENNIYRWNVRALSTALDTISEYLPNESSVNLIQLRFGIPQIETQVNTSDWIEFRNDTIENFKTDSSLLVSYRSKENWDKIKHQKPVKRNTAKFDIVFYPQLYLTNLTFEHIYEAQFNIAPAVEVSFWKGMLFTAQAILPIYNNSKIYGEEGSKVRLGFLTLSQNFRLPGPLFGRVSVGNFNYNRYGADLTIVYPFKNPRWHLGLNAGLTGYSYYEGSTLNIGDLNTVSFTLNAGYFLPRFNLRFDVQAGRYLKGDYGGRFDLTRMFGETALGFYASYSTMEIGESGQPNFGFHLAVPFPPGKRFKHKTVRVNVPRYFDWEYNGATEFVYGRYYEVRPNENRSEHYFNPVYIKNELLKNRHY